MQPFALEIAHVVTDSASARVSVNTLERHFAEYLGQSRCLRDGRPEACTESGFSDCSGFIALFKKAYRITPLQYKKKWKE